MDPKSSHTAKGYRNLEKEIADRRQGMSLSFGALWRRRVSNVCVSRLYTRHRILSYSTLAQDTVQWRTLVLTINRKKKKMLKEEDRGKGRDPHRVVGPLKKKKYFHQFKSYTS